MACEKKHEDFTPTVDPATGLLSSQANPWAHQLIKDALTLIAVADADLQWSGSVKELFSDPVVKALLSLIQLF